jgi:predicted ATPase
MFTSIRVAGYRSIADSGEIPLGPVTVLVGLNNSGKSAFLYATYLFQEGGNFTGDDVRIGDDSATAELAFDKPPPQFGPYHNTPVSLALSALRHTGQPEIIAKLRGEKNELRGIKRFPGKEPLNVILPVLAGRRVGYYRQQPSRESSLSVQPQDSSLVSRIQPLIGSQTQEGIRFAQLCRDVLHVSLQVLPGENQQSYIGVQVDLHTSIPLEAMGTGIAGTLSLLVGLCQAKNKLFLIEEPEDDLHPAALKALLDAIIVASKHNQFLISTHSSIVLTRLGALPETRVVHVTSDGGLPPTSTFTVKETQEERMGILRDLGYSLADFSLGEGWLIFEESSAERLVYEWLAPWFAPGLLRLRHVSARGNGRVESLLTDFKEMFLYAHLEPVYRHRAWVILDGDEESLKILEQLKSNFKGWPASRFRHWSEPIIERYYPQQFADKYANEIEGIQNKWKRQEAKQELFKELTAWILEDPERAKRELEISATEMIEVLRSIESDLAGMP